MKFYYLFQKKKKKSFLASPPFFPENIAVHTYILVKAVFCLGIKIYFNKDVDHSMCSSFSLSLSLNINYLCPIHVYFHFPIIVAEKSFMVVILLIKKSSYAATTGSDLNC